MLLGMRKLTMLIALLGLLSAAFLLPGVASATQSTPVATTTFTLTQAPGSTESACPVRLNNGPLGQGICDTAATYMVFNDGTQRLFVIGLDHAVWNIVQYPNGTQSGWRSLAGWVQQGVYSKIFDARYANDLEIWAPGSDGLAYCRALHGSWGAWHRC